MDHFEISSYFLTFIGLFVFFMGCVWKPIALLFFWKYQKLFLSAKNLITSCGKNLDLKIRLEYESYVQCACCNKISYLDQFSSMFSDMAQITVWDYCKLEYWPLLLPLKFQFSCFPCPTLIIFKVLRNHCLRNESLAVNLFL